MTGLRRASLVLCVVVSATTLVLSARQAAAPASKQASTYFPAKGAWEKRDPAAVGMNKAKLDEAIAFAMKNENPNTKDLAVDIPNSFRAEAPYNNLIGPTQVRAGMSGVVIYKGYQVAEWGDTARADMTFSVTKSFLSTVVGLAYDRKHDQGPERSRRDVHAEGCGPVHVRTQRADHVGPPAAPDERLVRHLCSASPTGPTGRRKTARRRPTGRTDRSARPGTFYKYNDVRVNVLSLATLYVMKEPLPVVLKTSIMDPIGASDTWHWEPYENAYVTIDGKRMPSVPGGGHHGGGMFINAHDMARFGYLFLRNGKWNGKQLISEKWIAMARTPGTATNNGSKTYGFMNWFLNNPAPAGANGQPGRKQYPLAPESAVSFNGNGSNLIYMDWENDLVVVVRWIRGGAGEFFAKVIDATQ